jgi:CheY-like chemotaxis protein
MKRDEPIILLVDDSHTDTKLMQAAWKQAECANSLQVAPDGVAAVAYLAGDGPYSDRHQHPLPAVMLLDLNMPGKNGFEVLAWVRQQSAFKRLPVFVLSASSRTADVEQAFDLGANAFLMKPGTLSELRNLVRCLCDWLAFNQFAPPP